MKSIKLVRNASITLSILFAFIGLSLGFTPLYIFGYYPAGFALVFAILAFFISKKNNFLTKIPIILIVLSIIAASIISIRLLTQENEISKDEVIEELVNQEKEETVDDLEDALENLD